MTKYATVTVVIDAAERADFMRLLAHAETVRFAASDDGVSDYAVALGAEPGDWDESDEEGR